MDVPASPTCVAGEKITRPGAVLPGSGCKEVMIDDTELLRRYARERSDDAFATLVQRKAGLVYSAALRQVGGDVLLAQDVAQSVFIDLARKARRLDRRPVLTSWLYTSTRFAARKALRAQSRRLLREQQAHTMQQIENSAPTPADWEKLRPFLDDAMCGLSDADRDALLMRYFEGQPYAAMAARLGIAENSARMRADRAIDKLRSILARRGIASTAAALGLVLSTQAVAAPPAGLAATLATTALAQTAALGAGAGFLTKFYQFASMNKLPTSVATVATVGAGVVSYEVNEHAQHTAFTIYAICFGVGLLFAIASAIGAHVFGGHGEIGHDADLGHAHVSAHAHAEAGANTSDMPGFAPLSPTTIATFITAFGGLGMILGQLEFTHDPWVSAPLSAIGALLIAMAVFMLFRALFRRTQASSEGRVVAAIGLEATVITPIAPTGVGEIAYIQAGTRYSAPARADDGLVHPNGAAVRITRIVGSQFYVAAN